MRRGIQQRIGTAGWAIPAQFSASLPSTGSHLERYARHLNAAEINSSFYRYHRLRTYARWASSVPPDFRFSVKLPRALSHNGELVPEPATLDRFLDETSGLGSKLGALLLQLPPKLVFDASTVETFLNALRKRTSVPLVCEPRHPSWASAEADTLLLRHSVSRVAADPPRWHGGDEPGGARELAYFRLHGQPRIYYSDYDPEKLAALRQQVARASDRASEVWVIFDNTALGCALGNALSLDEALRT